MTRTAVETIALVVHPVWIYYRQEMCDPLPPTCLTDKLASGKGQRILDALPHLTRAEAGFLALVADVISAEDSAEGVTAAPDEEEDKEFAKSIRSVGPDTAPRPGFFEELWRRIRALRGK